MIFGIWMAVLGLLAIPSLVIARKPDAKALIDRLAPFQGWLGAISALWGTWGIISCVLNLQVLTAWPIWWSTWLACSITLLGLGLLLGVGVLKSFIKAPAGAARMDQAIARIAPLQGKLGIAGIALGIWTIVASLMFLG